MNYRALDHLHWWKRIGWALIALVIVLSLVAPLPLPAIGPVCWRDKASHLLAYAVSKGALQTLSRNLGDWLPRTHGVRCNHFNVGWTLTENEYHYKIKDGLPADWPEKVSKKILPTGKLMKPETIAAWLAADVAAGLRDAGLRVLLLMDSVTRLCQAQRQVGLSAGEPPTTRGFPPSVFSLLPTVLERCGRTTRGSITGFFAVLVEGDELTDPIADATRGILDGHVQLSQELASRGHYPAIDVLSSISRVADAVTTRDHQAARRDVLKLLSSYRQVEDLLNIGAYPAGSNPDFDMAIACKPAIDQLLQQGRNEVKGKASSDQARKLLVALANSAQEVRKKLARPGQRAAAGPG